MFSLRRIRSQMYFGVIMLMIVVTVLSAASLHGVLKFRKLTKSIRARSTELPAAATLVQTVSDLRSELFQLSQKSEQYLGAFTTFVGDQPVASFATVNKKLNAVTDALDAYQTILENSETRDPRIAKNDEEMDFVVDFRKELQRVAQQIRNKDQVLRSHYYNPLEMTLSDLQNRATKLPGLMQVRMDEFAENARTEYRAWMTFSILLGIGAMAMIGFLMIRFRDRIFRPLQKLLAGSRQVASGNYDYRIELETDDEVAELADALNAMTRNFQAIQSDLNRQVQQRTKEVVRSEKMASVGFLAAGVAHEINNPLATIAWSAESLESRLYDILESIGMNEADEPIDDIEEMKKYLRRIQDEAFRCKGITAGLLDFSRMGDVKKTTTNLAEVIEGVIEMVRPLSKYRDKNILFNAEHGITCVANEQEMKQVALNLITNALGSVDAGGTVSIDLEKVGDKVEFRVADDGCGLTEEIKQHLFEPFFTRRRDGQGTGLGLSITYQIIQEHGGQITPFSDGPGKGSTFTVSLPLVKNDTTAAPQKIAA